jgi:hypothetical protein
MMGNGSLHWWDRPPCRLSSGLSKILSESRALGLEKKPTHFGSWGVGGFLKRRKDMALVLTHGPQRPWRDPAPCWARSRPKCLRKKATEALSFPVCSRLFQASLCWLGKGKTIFPGTDDGGRLYQCRSVAATGPSFVPLHFFLSPGLHFQAEPLEEEQYRDSPPQCVYYVEH